ncbi:Lipolytic enzyme [Mycena kentingensis (nom. inval.)]|nr:Lipolytic enzyme [Mycena kentingensis (nom. inval.)]
MPPLRSLLAALALIPACYAAGFSGKSLRIMPLGASITLGGASKDGNGYRETLYKLLAADGNVVQMVGSQVNGTMESPWSEGYPGLVIDQVRNKSAAAMSVQNPNIVTLLVGTNDMTENNDVANAPARLTALIQSVLDAPPLTLVVVSSLPPTADPAANARVKTFNAAIPGIVQKFTDAGRTVVFVDSYAVVKVEDLADDVHPNDTAYARIGRAFYDGIQSASGGIFPLQGDDPVDGFKQKTTRIMALGGSITAGAGNGTGNGYRQRLVSLLTADGNIVDMVGSQSSGNMSDPWHEGYAGLTIAQLTDRAAAQTSLRLPNIVTIHTGTVDMLNNDDPAGAPDRLRNLIQKVLDAPPLTLVVVSTLIPAGDAAVNARIKTFNAALPAVVAGFVKDGRSVLLVDCNDVVAAADLVDGVNPDDAAYARMARVYYNGLQIAAGKGWIWDVQGSAPQDGEQATAAPQASTTMTVAPLETSPLPDGTQDPQGLTPTNAAQVSGDTPESAGLSLRSGLCTGQLTVQMFLLVLAAAGGLNLLLGL